jgi:hypothetical protein
MTQFSLIRQGATSMGYISLTLLHFFHLRVDIPDVTSTKSASRASSSRDFRDLGSAPERTRYSEQQSVDHSIKGATVDQVKLEESFRRCLRADSSSMVQWKFHHQHVQPHGHLTLS